MAGRRRSKRSRGQRDEADGAVAADAAADAGADSGADASVIDAADAGAGRVDAAGAGAGADAAAADGVDHVEDEDSESEEDVEQAELETIGSRLRSRRGPQREAADILLYDGDLIAYADQPGGCDPEAGYHLVEVLGAVPLEYRHDWPHGPYSRIRACRYFNEQIGVRGCLWMPLGMDDVAVPREGVKWIRVKATTGLKGDRVQVSWAEHKRIQRELGVQGVTSEGNDGEGDADEEEEEEEEEDDDAAESSDDDGGVFAVPTGSSSSSQRSHKNGGTASRSASTRSTSADAAGDDSDNDQPPTKKARASRRSSGASPGKATSTTRSPRVPKAPKAPKPIKYKKGFVAPRPAVLVVDTDPVFFGKEPVKGGEHLHSLDVLRAVNNNDLGLLAKAFADTKHVACILYARSPTNPDNGLTLAARAGNVEVLLAFSKHFQTNGGARERVTEPPSSLQALSSGSVGIATFGHHVGPVGAARGGRELHNAMLTAHSRQHHCDATVIVTEMFRHCRDSAKLERVLAVFGRPAAEQAVHVAMRAGNRALTAHLVSKMQTGWDFNHLHLKALSTDGSAFAAFREVSVTKKANYTLKSVAPVHMAAINPDAKYLKELLAVHSDCAVSDTEQWRIAHYAAACDGDGPLSLLKERGADLMCATRHKDTPLLVAAGLGRLANVQLLLADEASRPLLLKQKDREANTALHLAARHGHADVVEALIAAGARESFGNQLNMTPMGVAAAFGHLDVIRRMREKGFSLVKPDRRQRPPLILACREGQLHVVRYLLHHGADADCSDSSGNSAAHYAAAYGWLPVLRSLVEQGGAAADAVASWKATPLSCAALKHQAECVVYLAGLSGVDLNVIDARGRTIASNLCTLPSHPGLDQLKLLIARGADVTIADADGLTPLHHLCASADAHPRESRANLVERFAQLLLQSGADAERKAKDGSTPLLSAFNGINQGRGRGQGAVNTCAAGYLVGRGVSVTAVDNRGRNPLHLTAAKLGDAEAPALVTALLRHKDAPLLVNAYDDSGRTPLLVALQDLSTIGASYGFWNAQETTKHAANIKKLIACKHLDASLPMRRVKKLADGDGGNGSKTAACEAMDQGDSDEESMDDDDCGSECDDDDDDDDDPRRRRRKTPVGAAVSDGKPTFELVDEDESTMFAADQSTQLGYTPLHWAVQRSDVEWTGVLDALFKKPGIDLDARCVGGFTPLHLTLKLANDATLKQLLHAKADVNKRNFEGETALHMMTRLTQKTSPHFKAVLAASDLSLTDRRGRSVLHLAGQAGDWELARTFLEAGAALSGVDRLGRTALHYAVATGASRADASSDFEAMLLKRGSDVNARDVFERTPLHYAFLPALYTEPERATPEQRLEEATLEKIKELTGKAETSSTSKYDPIETVYCLFSVGKGTLVDALDAHGRSPLHYAAKVSALTCSLHLLTHGADINLRDRAQGDMPLRMALCYDNPEYAVMMLQKGAQTTPGRLTASKDAHRIEVELQSVFYLAVSKGWLGVSYMIFDSDFPLFDGLRDAMLTQKYVLMTTLMKKVADEKLLAVDGEQRGLLHWLAISARRIAADAGTSNVCTVAGVLLAAGCDANAADAYGRTALHYAAQRCCVPLVQQLTSHPDINVDARDVDGNPALVLAVQGNRRLASDGKLVLDAAEAAVAKLLARGHFSAEIHDELPRWEHAIEAAAKLLAVGARSDVRYSDPTYADGETTLLCHAVRQGSHELFGALLRAAQGAEAKKVLCGQCDEQGMSPLAHSVIVNETALAAKLLPHSDVQWTDAARTGRSLAHLVVQPIQYGSYENVGLLKKLANAGAPLDLVDVEGKTATQYAKLQDSGRMTAQLRELGAAGLAVPGMRRDRTVWKKFTDVPHSVAEDCQAYIAEAATKEKPKPNVDILFEKRDTSNVYEDESGVLFDVMLNKVDISHGAFGYNNYYRMQVLHETVQGAYYLWTHWGRWGDSTGMFQRTPFNTAKEACTEFSKIFRSKTGNDFAQCAADAAKFTAQPKKYSLMSTDRSHATVPSLLVPFDLDAVPASALHKTLQSTLEYLVDVTALRDRARVHGLSEEGAEKVLMFGEASAEKLFQARSVLLELLPLVKSYLTLRYEPNCDVDRLLEKNDRIVKLSQQYYEIVPFAHTAFGGSGSSPMVIMSEESMLIEAMSRLDQLSDLSLTARLLLAAWYRRKTVNPLDYVFKSMEASMVPLATESLERQIIETYMASTAEGQLKQIKLSALYKVERRGEPERMEKFRSLPNHRLLWHGSPQVNIIGILSQGLLLTRGNPSNGLTRDTTTEENIWNGLYFADMFAKSYGYTGCFRQSRSWSRQQRTESKGKGRLYMLLCEVALGNMQTYTASNYHEASDMKLPSNKDSLLCPGNKAPNWDNAIVLPNGVEIPLGEAAHHNRKLSVNESSKHRWPMAEYIVPDESRVRIRYVLEIVPKEKDD